MPTYTSTYSRPSRYKHTHTHTHTHTYTHSHTTHNHVHTNQLCSSLRVQASKTEHELLHELETKSAELQSLKSETRYVRSLIDVMRRRGSGIDMCTFQCSYGGHSIDVTIVVRIPFFFLFTWLVEHLAFVLLRQKKREKSIDESHRSAYPPWTLSCTPRSIHSLFASSSYLAACEMRQCEQQKNSRPRKTVRLRWSVRPRP